MTPASGPIINSRILPRRYGTKEKQPYEKETGNSPGRRRGVAGEPAGHPPAIHAKNMFAQAQGPIQDGKPELGCCIRPAIHDPVHQRVSSRRKQEDPQSAKRLGQRRRVSRECDDMQPVPEDAPEAAESVGIPDGAEKRWSRPVAGRFPVQHRDEECGG